MTVISSPTPTDLLSSFAAREDRSRGFGKAAAVSSDAVPMLGGAPSPDMLPLERIRRAAEDLTGDPAALADTLQYSVPTGRSALRSWVARREGVSEDRVLITNGAFHGLSLLFDALLDAGDSVIAEDPTYPLVFRNLQHKEPTIVPLSLGPDGLDVDDLERSLAAGARPKLFYTVPDFHNPTGFVTPAADRERLVALAERYGFVIVSDNAYDSLGFDGTQPADYPLASDRVAHVRTFSKILGPGLRLGWLVLPEWLVGPVTRIRANQDQHSSVLVQSVVARVVGAEGSDSPETDPFESIAARSRAAYAERFDLVAGALDREVPGGIEVDHRTGGIFLWARLRDHGIDLAAAQQLARTRFGTDFVLGRYFFRSRPDDDRHSLRIGISHLEPARLSEGTDRLIAALTDPGARP